jgi:hypothetical protein
LGRPLFEIIPLQGVGPIRFGMRPSEVRFAMGRHAENAIR